MVQVGDIIEEATRLFHEHRADAEKYADVKELALLSAGRALGLSELLDKFGFKPEIKGGPSD